MYEITQIKEDLFELHSNVLGIKSMQGTQLAILIYASHVLGFKLSELQEAFIDMIQTGNTTAHFGISQSFMYSYNKGNRKAG